MLKKNLIVICLFALCVSSAAAQRPHVTLTLNEGFVDSLLDALFRNTASPEFSLAAADEVGPDAISGSRGGMSARQTDEACRESIRLLREGSGVRTAVRFRDGKIQVPLAFEGNYNPPLVGCLSFAGYAEAYLELEFDRPGQRLIAKAVVTNVVLNGSGGLGGSVIAKMVQNSIDRKLNPIEVVRMEKLSFLVPIQNSSGLRMNATELRHEVSNGSLLIHIVYDFVKA